MIDNGSWWTALPIALIAVALLLCPGLVTARAWGVRGLTALGAAPALTLGVVGPATLLADLLSVRWDARHLLTGPAMWLWVGACLLGLVLTRLRARSDRDPSFFELPALGRSGAGRLAGALMLAGLATAVPALVGTGGPESPAQASDAVFHLSAVAFIRENGVASPFTGVDPMYDGVGGYYPTTWHALAAVLPGSVVAGANVLVVVLAAVVWPLGMAALLREVLGRIRPASEGDRRASGAAPGPGSSVDATVLAVATALSGSVVSLLVVLISVWPYSLSVAVTPGALALGVRGCVAGRAGARVRLGALLVLALACVGVVSAHGTGVFDLAVLGGPVALAALVPVLHRWWSAGRIARIRLLGGGVLVLGVLLAGAWGMRSSLQGVAALKRASSNTFETLWAVVSDHPMLASFSPWIPGNILVTALAVLGATAAWRVRARRPWCVSTGLALGLLLLASGPTWPLRVLAAPWYTQRARIMPLLTIGLLVLAALGIEETRRRWGAGRAGVDGAAGAVSAPRSVAGRLRRLATRHVPAMLLLASLLLAPAWRWGLRTEMLQSIHDPDQIAFGTMLSDDELALIRRAPDELPADAVVLGDPSNGSAYLWSVSGVRVVYPSRNKQLGDLLTLGERLDRIGTDPEICRILNERGIHYYYTDDTRTDGATGGGRPPLWGEALGRLPHQYLEEIDHAASTGGTVTLWRITGCTG